MVTSKCRKQIYPHGSISLDFLDAKQEKRREPQMVGPRCPHWNGSLVTGGGGSRSCFAKLGA